MTDSVPTLTTHILSRRVISDLLEDVEDLSKRYPFTLVTALDGARNLAANAGALKRVERGDASVRLLGTALLVQNATGRELLGVAESLFDHNDEVCFFESEPSEAMANAFAAPIPDTAALAARMAEANCPLILRDDADGITILSTDKRMAEYLSGVYGG